MVIFLYLNEQIWLFIKEIIAYIYIFVKPQSINRCLESFQLYNND